MAQTTAAINLEVKGGSKLERIIQSVSRLESIVNNINAVPLKLDIAKADTAFSTATKGLSDVRQGIKQAQKDFNAYDRVTKNLEKDFVSAARAVSKLTVGSQEHIDALINQLQVEGRLTEARKKRGQLEERLQKQESKLPGAQRYLEEAERVRKLTAALTDLSDEYLKLGRSQTRTPVTGKVAASQTRGSIAQLQGQADALALVANNSEIASKQFNRFIVASQVASQKVFEGRQRQLKALAEGLALPGDAETRRQVGLRIGKQQDIAGARSLIGDVIASYGGIVKSEAALGSYVEQLRSLQSIVPFDSQEWSLLETAINDVSGELRQLEQRFAGLRGQSSSLAKPIASLLPQFSVQSADKQARYKQGVQRKQEDQLEKLVDLEYEISKIKLDQNETLDLRNRLEKIFDDTTAGSIEAAKKQTVELKRQIRVIKDRNKEAGSDKAAGERPFATPLGGGAELKERLKASRSIAEAEKQIADATELAANAAQRLIGLESSQQLQSAFDDYTNGLKAIEEGADKILSKDKKLEQQFDKNLKQALASKKESLRVSEQFDSALERVSGAETRIEIAAEKGLISEIEKKKLLLNLDEARLAIDEKRFTVARTISSEVDRERKSREGKVRPEVIKTGQVSPIEGRRKVEGAIRSAQILERQLLAADKEGLNVSKELAAVKDAIASAGSDDYQNTRKTLGALLEANSAASDRLRLEKLIADEQKKSVVKGGTIRGGETLALDTPSRLRGMQRSGVIFEQSLINLRAKGVDTSEELIKLQGALNKTKEDGYQITRRELDLLEDQLDSARKYIQLQKEILSGKSGGGGGKKDKTPGAGLEEALRSLRQARQAREQFLGGTSPAEAIDKIVREFNTGKSEAGDAAGNVAQTFAANLRKGIPEAVAASAALAGASIDAILKKLGIKSPSRVMIEIARNLVDTYVNVLEAAIPEIQQASQKAFALPADLDVVNTTSFPLPKNQNITSAIAQSVASFVDPMQSRGFGEFQAFDLIMQKGRTLEPRNVPGIDYSAAEDAAVRGRYGDPEFEKVRQAYVEFYNIPSEFAPDIERAGNAAGQASEDAKRLEAEVTGLVSGLEQISNLLRGTADLVRVPSTAAEQAALPVQEKAAIDFVGDYWSNAAVDAKELDERLKREFSGPGATGLMAMVDFWDTSFDQAQRIAKQADEAAAEAQKAKQQVAESFAPSVQKAEQLDEERRRQATFDAFAAARQQAEADARTASEAIASQIVEPVKKSAPQGERKIQAAISSLFDRVSEIFKGIGGFGGRGGAGGGGGRGGAGGGGAGGGGDFGRRLEQAVAQGPEALLGLRELAKPATASIRELEALSAVLKKFRAVLDPTVQGFDRLDKQLRETAANLDRQIERRAPDAEFLTRTFGARGGRAVSEGLIGGAFPLLFGQGIGAAALGGLGGAAGGFAGGGLGFGLSLVGTALGTAFDEAVQGAKELGDALQKPVENFDQLAEKSFFSSKALEDTIKKTIEYGDTATASALIQEEAIKKLGVGGVENLKTLGTESDRLNRAFAELGQQMQAVASGPLASITGFFANIFGQAAAAGRVRLLRANLSPEQTGQFNQEVRQRLQQQGIQRGFFAPSAPTDAEIGMLQDRGALQDIVDKWQAIEIQGKIKLDPKQVIESEINALQKKLEVLDIGKSLKDQFRSAAREQEDLDKQRADLVRSYEESIGDIRKRVEDEVASRRFSILEKENQLLDQQGQNRLRQLQLINQEIIAGAGQGQRPEVEEAARRAAEIVAQFTEDQLSAEQEAAKIKRDAALDALKFDYQAAEFKASIEKEVSRLNVETARRVADINEQVRRRNEEFDNRRFAIEKQIADLQLKMMQNELALATKNANLPIEARQAAFDLYRLVGEQRTEVMKTAAPPALRGVGQVGGGGVPTQSIDAVVSQQRQAIAAVVNAALEAQDLLSQQGIQNFRNSIDTLIKGVEAPINAINQSILDADKERTRYSELISQGLTETVAQRVVEIEKAKELAIAQLDTIINELEKRKAVEATTEALRAQIDTEIQGIKDRKKALEEAAGTAPADGKPGTGLIGRAVESEKGRKIQDFINSAQEELNDLESVAIRVSQGIGDAVGNSIANGISGLVEGTTTAKEVFADFLKDVGQILVKEGAKMIATYVAIGIARIFAGLQASTTSATGPNPGGIPSTGNVTAPSVNGFDTGSIANIAANGAYFDGGMAYFANGGIVSSPTLFQFADGGSVGTGSDQIPFKLGVMGEAGPEAIMPLKRVADGRLGVSSLDLPFQKRDNEMSPEAGDAFSELRSASVPFTKTTERLMTERSERETVAAINNPKPLDVRFESQVINGVEYVTAEQHQKGMAQAAERGRALTLAALQNSVKTRKKVGI